MSSNSFFEILASGTAFDPEAFLVSSPIEVDRIWRTGEPKSVHGPPDSRFKNSGIRVTLGDGNFLSFPLQVEIACKYLRRRETALKAIGNFANVDSFFLRLQCNQQIAVDTVGFGVFSTPEPMRLAADIGFELGAHLNLIRADQM